MSWMGCRSFLPLGRASYYRIFLEKLLPDSLSRVLYLDGISSAWANCRH
jgi:hypothetical protein